MTASNKSFRAALENNADRLKGALIIVVAADHNDWFRKLAPAMFEPLTFHVLGFLLLAFTFSSKQWGIQFVADRVARYLVPYWWALTAASAAFQILYRPPGTLKEASTDWLLAVVLGNAPFTKAASGLLMLWFLPTLFGLACATAIYDNALNKHSKKIVAFLAVIGHLFIPLSPREWLFWLPFGMAITAHVFLLGLVWRKAIRLTPPIWWGPVVCIIFLASYTPLIFRPAHLEIAVLDFYGIDNGFWFLLQDLAGITGILATLWLVGHPHQAKWLEAIGRKSLLIYLLHPVTYIFLGKIWPVAANQASTMLLVQGCMALTVTILFSYLLAHIISSSQLLSEWITPRSWAQWAPIGLLNRFRNRQR